MERISKVDQACEEPKEVEEKVTVENFKSLQNMLRCKFEKMSEDNRNLQKKMSEDKENLQKKMSEDNENLQKNMSKLVFLSGRC
jgi:hypothetical protein